MTEQKQNGELPNKTLKSPCTSQTLPCPALRPQRPLWAGVFRVPAPEQTRVFNKRLPSLPPLPYPPNRALLPSYPTQNFVTLPRFFIDPKGTSSFLSPKGISILTAQFPDGRHHKIAYVTSGGVSRGTLFGPMAGQKIPANQLSCDFAARQQFSPIWEVFEEGKVTHYLDGTGQGHNWMKYVPVNRLGLDNNLEVTQLGSDIYYRATQNIPPGTQLSVWYSKEYLFCQGVVIGFLSPQSSADKSSKISPLSDSKFQTLKLSEGESLPPMKGPSGVSPASPGLSSNHPITGEGFACTRCGKIFAYQYYRDKHLKYTRCIDRGDRKFPCTLCTRSFEKRDRLRIHVLHVHEKHRPHKCTVCGKSFSQSSSLNKHFRVHSGERPYKCLFCCKAFTASSILRTHLRQHSGEKPFKCRFCVKSFASHAAHDSHVRRTHPGESLLECLKCGLKLQSRQLLNTHHTYCH